MAVSIIIASKEEKMKKALVLAGLVTSTMFCLSGCGKEKEIVFWNPFTGSDGEIIQGLVDEFNETDPEYKIKSITMSADDMYTKIPTVVASGDNMPDMGIVHYYKVAGYREENIIIPIDEYIEEQPEIKEENYLAAAWEFGEGEDGKRYAVPLDLNGTVGYYNEDLLNKYAPEALDDGKITWEEIVAIGEKAQVDGITAYGGGAFTTDQFYTFLGQTGGEIIKDGEPNIDSSESRKVIEIMQSIYDSGYSTLIGDDNYGRFSNGETVFTPEGTWTVLSWKTDYPELNYKVTGQLSVSDIPYNLMSSHQFVVYNNQNDESEVKEKKQQIIGEFLEFIRQNSDKWAEAGHLPASLEALESAEFMEMPQSVLMKTEEQRESLKLMKDPSWSYVSDALNNVLEDILLENISVDDGLAQAQKEAEDKIEANQ